MLRKIVIGVVGVGVVVTGAMWAAATYFLDNATIAEQLKKETAQRFNRTLVFQGELQTKFFPKIQTMYCNSILWRNLFRGCFFCPEKITATI